MNDQQTSNKPEREQKSKRKTASVLVSSLSVFFSVLMVLFLGFSVSAMNTSCSSTPETHGSADLLSEDLSTEHKVQNVISSPFRLVGGMIVYPLKALFVDFPSALYHAFDGELAEYTEKLKSKDPKDREEALFYLSFAKDDEAWVLILDSFKDPDDEVRKQAVLALTKRKNLPKIAVDKVRGIVSNNASDSAVLLAAIYALGDLGDESDIEILEEIFKDSNNADVFNSFALLSLAKLGYPDAESESVKILETPKKHAVMYANALLGIGYCGMKTEQGKKVLHQSIAHEDNRIFTAAITGLGVAKDFEFLEKQLDSPNTPVVIKQKILVVLGEYGGAEKIDLIKKFFRRSGDENIRLYAIFGLAKARYRPIVGELIKNLEIDSQEIQANQKKALNMWSRLGSLGFLYELTGENFGIEYKPWKDWWESNKEDYLENTDN